MAGALDAQQTQYPDAPVGEYASGPINLASIRGLIYRQRYILGGVVALALLAGFVLTLLMTPMYSAGATVRIDPGGSNIVQGQDIDPGVPSNEIDRYIGTQAAVIKSRRLAYRVVDALKLAGREDFLGETATAPTPEGMSAEQWQNQKREIAAAMVVGGTSVDIPADRGVLTISFTSPNPQIAALIANSLAENYVTEDLRRSLEMNAYAQDYLKKQVDSARIKLREAELAANAFAKANGIVGSTLAPANSEDGPAPTITVSNLASINATYSAARAKRIETEQRWNAVANIPASQLPEVQQNASIQDMVTSRSKAAAELSELRERYGEKFPRIEELKAQIASLDAQISRSSADVKSAIRNDYLVALRQEQALSGELGKVSGDTLDEQDRRVQYNLLDREASALRTQLASLLERYNQISAAANLQPGTSSLLDSAKVPGGPVSPNLMVNLMLALVLGVAAALSLAFLREVLDDRVRSPEDVENKLGVPLLGYTPEVAEGKLDEELDNTFSAIMEAYSSIRTSVDFAVPGTHRVLQVTSSQPSEGKSITAVELARKYAQLGRKTLLIDADLRKPSVASYFNAKRQGVGLAEVLLGDAPLESALLQGTPENLDVLTVGEIPANPVDLLSSQVLIDFIDRYRSDYTLIVFDSPPVMGLADAPLLSRLVDATVFIVEANKAHFGQAKTALRRLRTAGANVVGIVLTKYRAAEAGYSYNYHYSYYSYGNRSKD